MPVASMSIPVVGPGRPLHRPHSSPLRAPWLPSPPNPTPPSSPRPLPSHKLRPCWERKPGLGASGAPFATLGTRAPSHSRSRWGRRGGGGRISRRPLALLNPLSLKCKELWNQTASHSNLGCLFLAGSAPRFRDADLRVSGSGVSNSDAYRVLASDWGGQVWNSVPFGVTSLTQPQPISPGGGDESLVLPDLIFFFF